MKQSKTLHISLLIRGAPMVGGRAPQIGSIVYLCGRVLISRKRGVSCSKPSLSLTSVNQNLLYVARGQIMVNS